MFLSILIPVFNWDLAPLLKILNTQCELVNNIYDVEIIVIDDGSAAKFNNEQTAEELAFVKYYEFEKNQGRVAARNALLKYANGEFVLFLDADMLPDDDIFLQTYLEILEKGADIICGGISYKLQNYDPAASFYLYKSQKTEALSASRRNKTPWRYLFTSNVVVRKYIVDSLSFDPRFSGYGLEDIDWGIRLAKLYNLEHIDNTCSHLGVLSKEQTYRRMCESIANYYLFYNLHGEKIGRSGVVGVAGFLVHLPGFLLTMADFLLQKLFALPIFNVFLFIIFQLNKAVLLARFMKTEKSSCPK